MAPGDVKVIGGEKNFWLYSETDGFDLTHPATPTSPPIHPRIPLETTKGPVTIDPAKAALVVIDLQNFFLSPLLGRPSDSPGIKVADRLLEGVIPACRTAGIPIVWLGWGLTDQDIEEMPPTIIKGFWADTNFVGERRIWTLGADIGPLKQDDGTVIEAGRTMIREQWNTAFFPSLAEKAEPQDMLVFKNRLSGFWGGTGIEKVLNDRGIKTLLFCGCNTDQCVANSLQDAYTKGWDCLMLTDGCATNSPEFATLCTEFNCEGGWGFLLTCKQLVNGVANTQTSSQPPLH